VTPAPPGRNAALAPLARRRRLARLALAWEAIWPAIWPALGVLGVFLTIALLGIPLLLPGWARMLVAAAFFVGFAAALRHGLRGFRWPGDDPADRRLERESGLDHRPLATLTDTPAGADPLAQAVWQVHRDRVLSSVRRLRVGLPRPGLARRDPIALRAALGLSLLAALVIAGPEAPERLRRAFAADVAMPAPPAPMRLEAWITPPAYTAAAPVFLDPAGGEVSVPAGSRLQVALSGGTGGAPDLLLGSLAAPFRVLDTRSFGAEAVLDQGARLVIRRDGTEVAAWTLTVQADQPPRVAFTEAPGRSLRGLAIRLPWQVQDDWGAVALNAEIRLKPRPDAPPHAVEIPLPAQARDARGVAAPDLSAHPWAGLDVEIVLRARDGAEQEGVSDAAALTLPERSFTHPVAQALIALRKALSLDPTARAEARRELDRLAAAPEAFEHDTTTYLALRAARHRLTRDRRAEAVGEAQEIMWETALALEEGRAERTARALQQAREELRQALQEAQRQMEEQRQGEREERNAEQRTETERRIQELRDAIRRHLEAMAERLQQENAEAMPFDPQNRLMDRRDLDRRTDRMREANRQDRPEDAERELAELEEMLRALEEGRSARNEQQERRRQQRQRGEQQMGVVQDMVQRQTRMLDSGHRRAEAETQRREEERRAEQAQRRNPRMRPSPEQQQQQQQQRAEAEQQAQGDAQREARVQRALRRALGEVMQQFGDLTGEVPPQLGRADQAMREAQDQLADGGDARDAQQRAIRELVEGARQMAQQMQRQFGQQEGEGEGEGEDSGEMMGEGQGEGDGQDQAQSQGEGRDPLGRRTREAPGAQDNGSDTRVPDEAELLRTRRLQEELRKRGAERERPQDELDYIDRLLRRF
jgi:uncharacterized protein (TIGR02302 family)